jgi:3-hydroxyisobutyrate dehydrogenase-like beta-hydroxyacid dehydrogenase
VVVDIGRTVPTTRVGFIGVGQMGRPMVDRLVAAGFPLSVFVRRPELADELRAAGATVAPSIAELAAAVDVLVTCTFSDAQLREVVFDAGALAALGPGAALVNHVTGSPALAVEMATAAPAGARVVDAPVSGTADEIRAGELTVLVGGSADDLERVRPVLAAYASPIIHVGTVGDGQRIKLVNNLVFTVHLRVATLAAELGETLGVAPAQLARVIEQCSGASRALSLLQHLPAETMVDLARPFLAKDVAVVREVAHDLGVDLGLLDDVAGWVYEP